VFINVTKPIPYNHVIHVACLFSSFKHSLSQTSFEYCINNESTSKSKLFDVTFFNKL
jgi:hypothetical protein